MAPVEIKLIAFYLPQFHPIPENDAWWGKGFTEWTNVARARPLFGGHYQPHLPGELGFYDLRVAEVREAQADLAREAGLTGFCYYHYWFQGKRLLHRPIDEVLAARRPDFPFCLCWANENWTRRWDGMETEILLQQTYSAEDDLNHIEALLPFFKDRRYITVEGKPLFLVYKASKHPDIRAALDLWRRKAAQNGLPGLFLCNVEIDLPDHGFGPQHGFDASVEFAPDWVFLPRCNRDSFFWKALGRLGVKCKNSIRHSVYDYADLAGRMMAKPPAPYPLLPCVTPSWDNSARRKRYARIFHGSTPEKYEQWLATVIQRERQRPGGKGLVFINAWNEWAEGNHLEPCQKWGRQYMEATRRALEQACCARQNVGRI
jgi:lipopolysaccharide biosynthesis protein